MRVSLMTVTTLGRVTMLRERYREMCDQLYPWDEWVICTEFVSDLRAMAPEMFAEGRIKWVVSPDTTDLVSRRNLSAEACTGDLLVHVDDDDWQSPWRIEVQVQAFLKSPSRAVVGTNWLYAYFRALDQIHRISYFGARGAYVPGATICYRKEAWKERPFGLGEEGPFVQHFQKQGRFFNMPDPTLILYHRHSSNFSAENQFLQRSRSGQPRSALDVMAERRKNPGVPLPTTFDESHRDAMLAHEADVNAIFWSDLMGRHAYDRFRRREHQPCEIYRCEEMKQ